MHFQALLLKNSGKCQNNVSFYPVFDRGTAEGMWLARGAMDCSRFTASALVWCSNLLENLSAQCVLHMLQNWGRGGAITTHRDIRSPQIIAPTTGPFINFFFLYLILYHVFRIGMSLRNKFLNFILHIIVPFKT
jgi:hypothetical protein